MRDSIGATWIFSICLTFIVLFTAYLAISVNYAKAFKIKNRVISMIEEHEGYNSSMNEDIISYLVDQGYTAKGVCTSELITDASSTSGRYWELQSCIKYDGDTTSRCNACVYRMNTHSDIDEVGTGQAYYKVLTFFRFDLPVIGNMLTFQVSGESNMIYDFAY